MGFNGCSGSPTGHRVRRHDHDRHCYSDSDESLSFTTEECKARLETCEKSISEIMQNQAVVSMAIIRLTHAVDAAVKLIGDADDEQQRVDENLRDGKCPDGCCDIPEAPEASD
jgi:hypothetical protein